MSRAAKNPASTGHPATPPVEEGVSGPTHKKKGTPENPPETSALPDCGERPKQAGRPPKEINLEDLRKLAAMQCTLDEIAGFFEVAKSTLDKRLKDDPECREALDRGRECGRMSLRRLQIESARRGNVTMQIWLGKQYLGQRDKLDHDVTASVSVADRIAERRRERLARESGEKGATDAVHG